MRDRQRRGGALELAIALNGTWAETLTAPVSDARRPTSVCWIRRAAGT